MAQNTAWPKKRPCFLVIGRGIANDAGETPSNAFTPARNPWGKLVKTRATRAARVAIQLVAGD